MHEQNNGGKNTESTEKSFQAALLSAENLFRRQTEAPFPLLIIDD
jgi:hypothetical protein